MTPSSVPAPSSSSPDTWTHRENEPSELQTQHSGHASVPARQRSRGLWLIAMLGLVLASAALSMAVGSRPIPLADVWSALTGNGAEPDVEYVVLGIRGSRTVLALLVGAALGVAGAVIQALTRNPLADTGILGVNAGAMLAVTIGVGFFGVGSVTGYIWLSFLGAVIATVAVYALGSLGRGGASPVQLTLIGVALGSILLGISRAITLMDPEAFDSLRSWRVGSLYDRGWDIAIVVWPALAIGFIFAALAARPLNALALGDDLAAALGAKIFTTRVLVILSVTLLAGGAVAAAGPIAFVGLMVPHVARWFTGPAQPWVIAYSAVLGAALVTVADSVGRLLLIQEVPVGIVTAFVGAPVLIVLARRSRMNAL